MGRAAYGVRGMRLRKGDELVSIDVVTDDCSLFTVTDKGFGKRVDCTEYKVQARGGIGVINVKCEQEERRGGGRQAGRPERRDHPGHQHGQDDQVQLYHRARALPGRPGREAHGAQGRGRKNKRRRDDKRRGRRMGGATHRTTNSLPEQTHQESSSGAKTVHR